MSDSHRPNAVACFSVAASPDPSVMSRVLELFAKRGLVPMRFVGNMSPDADPHLELDIQMTGLPPDQIDYLARCMQQITCVRSVLTFEKPAGALGA
jgi:acetolactate synthase regulatory subunit